MLYNIPPNIMENTQNNLLKVLGLDQVATFMDNFSKRFNIPSEKLLDGINEGLNLSRAESDLLYNMYNNTINILSERGYPYELFCFSYYNCETAKLFFIGHIVNSIEDCEKLKELIPYFSKEEFDNIINTHKSEKSFLDFRFKSVDDAYNGMFDGTLDYSIDLDMFTCLHDPHACFNDFIERHFGGEELVCVDSTTEYDEETFEKLTESPYKDWLGIVYSEYKE